MKNGNIIKKHTNFEIDKFYEKYNINVRGDFNRKTLRQLSPYDYTKKNTVDIGTKMK